VDDVTLGWGQAGGVELAGCLGWVMATVGVNDILEGHVGLDLERFPTCANLVRSVVLADGVECGVEVVGVGVGGGDGVFAGLDLDGAVAACGADEFLDRPVGGVFDSAGYREDGKHDGQVGFDGRVCGGRSAGPGGRVGHAERLLDVEQPVVGGR
jgi:hypothetical protein